MASTVKEKNIANLRAAGYLAADIVHRLPDDGQVIPTPGPHERVVFLAHFVPGLGFALHPFVRGLMFYYGLDFHDLAPNFTLNISAFIIVCEAFLRIKPHFGLLLQIFCVKPKIVSGQQAECGGAMVGKMPNVTWLDGSFAETVKGWQSGWFYITEPRDANWAAAPEFQSGSPMRLTSWEQKGLSWGKSTELTGLINCIKGMKDKNIKLVNVIQVMLVRRILPCQRLPERGEVALEAPQGGIPDVGHAAFKIPADRVDESRSRPDSQPNTVPEPSMVPDLGGQPLVKEGEPSVPRTSATLEAADCLLEALRGASMDEEHRTLMSAVIQKVSSARSGLTKAYTSLLTGFEVSNKNL